MDREAQQQGVGLTPQMGAEATIRYLKAKLKVVEEELEVRPPPNALFRHPRTHCPQLLHQTGGSRWSVLSDPRARTGVVLRGQDRARADGQGREAHAGAGAGECEAGERADDSEGQGGQAEGGPRGEDKAGERGRARAVRWRPCGLVSLSRWS